MRICYMLRKTIYPPPHFPARRVHFPRSVSCLNLNYITIYNWSQSTCSNILQRKRIPFAIKREPLFQQIQRENPNQIDDEFLISISNTGNLLWLKGVVRHTFRTKICLFGIARYNILCNHKSTLYKTIQEHLLSWKRNISKLSHSFCIFM